jgi:hypothetical protein
VRPLHSAWIAGRALELCDGNRLAAVLLLDDWANQATINAHRDGLRKLSRKFLRAEIAEIPTRVRPRQLHWRIRRMRDDARTRIDLCTFKKSKRKFAT